MRLAGLSQELADENRYMLRQYEQAFGGAPADFLSRYHRASPYSFSDTTQRAIKPLVDLPIRFYTEPDIQYWLKQGVDYAGLNAFDLAAMTNDLRKMGNRNIALIATTGKGYRKPGNQRNPHAWSIAEPKDLVAWLLAQK